MWKRLRTSKGYGIFQEAFKSPSTGRGGVTSKLLQDALLRVGFDISATVEAELIGEHFDETMSPLPLESFIRIAIELLNCSGGFLLRIR